MHVGSSLDVGWDRACCDICKSQLRSKKYSALEKGSIRNLCCGGAWTADRAAEVGYQLSDGQLLCPLCRAHPDS
eukprot:7358848-Pyramimonas_sp.AAC.1